MNSQMIKKVRQLQNEMLQTQKEIEETSFSATVGCVTLTMLGTKDIKSVKVDEDYKIESSEDLEMLEDSIVAASNQLVKEINDFSEEKMAKYRSLLGGFGA